MVAWFERNFGTAKGLFLALLLALLCAKFRSWTFVCLVALAVGSCLLASLLRLVVPGLADLIALGASLGSALQVWWAEALCFFLACLFLGFVRRELGERAKARKILAEAPYDPASPPFRG